MCRGGPGSPHSPFGACEQLAFIALRTDEFDQQISADFLSNPTDWEEHMSEGGEEFATGFVDGAADLFDEVADQLE